MRIRIICEGKTKDEHLRALQAEFKKRIAHFCELTVEELKPQEIRTERAENRLTPGEQRLLEKLTGSTKILLDERGCQWTSAELAEWLGKQALRGTRELAFVLGGPDGFSRAFRQRADLVLALSRMTFPHDWARALLLEQLYRGFTILRGYPYPR